MIRPALVWAMLAGSAVAEPCGKEGLFLNCSIGTTKMLEVCLTATGGSYLFGPKGNPDLALFRPYAEMRATPWPGVSRSFWSEVIFSNEGVDYTVWHSVERAPDGPPAEGGVTVSKDGQELAWLTCDVGSVAMTVFAVSDAFQGAGYCWQRDTQSWQRQCDN